MQNAAFIDIKDIAVTRDNDDLEFDPVASNTHINGNDRRLPSNYSDDIRYFPGNDNESRDNGYARSLATGDGRRFPRHDGTTSDETLTYNRKTDGNNDAFVSDQCQHKISLRRTLLACGVIFAVSMVLGFIIGWSANSGTKNTGPQNGGHSDNLVGAGTNCLASHFSLCLQSSLDSLQDGAEVTSSPSFSLVMSSSISFRSTYSSVSMTSTPHPSSRQSTNIVSESLGNTSMAVTIRPTPCSVITITTTIENSSMSPCGSSTSSSTVHTSTTSCEQTASATASLSPGNNSECAQQCRQCGSNASNISATSSIPDDDDGLSRSPFEPLSYDEMRKVKLVLEQKGLTTYSPEVYDNRMSHVYLLRPDKQKVLDYLDNGGAFPGRFARVHVVRPSASDVDIVHYKVGPLDGKNGAIKIEQIVQDGVIHYNRKPLDSLERRQMYEMTRSHIEALDTLLNESFAISFQDVHADFTLLPADDIMDRISHVFLVLNMAGAPEMRLLPVSCTFHHPGINYTSDWFITDWFYLSQGPFKTSVDLQQAFDNDELRKVTFPRGYRETHNNELNLERNSSLPFREFSNIPPPRTYEPEGQRYTARGNKISWMGWEFEFSSDTVRGPGVFDVRFLSRRIAYEISLQDITLIYHPQTNGHGPLVLTDTFYLLGLFNEPRIELDCSRRGTVLQTTGFFAGYPTKSFNAACVFEADDQRALWRYRSRGLLDNYLVLRSVITLGNYHYTVEWNFHLDGKIQTLLTASGYLYGAFWDSQDPLSADDDPATTIFGYRLLDYMTGPIHDHTYTFKVDLDILGTNNSFQSINWKADASLKAFQTQSRNITAKPAHFYFNHTRYVEHEIVENEKTFVLDPLKPKYWTVVNENERNKWGVKRGYRVIPNSHFGEILTEHPMLKPWETLKYHLAISKHKDKEPYASDSLYTVTHPDIDMPSIEKVVLDAENIRHGDLVVWVSEKFLHLPSAEDVPVTLAAQSGFKIKPFNYFDRTPTFDLQAHYSDTEEPYRFQPCYEND